MNVWLAFFLGAASHVLAALTTRYAEWRFHHLGDPDTDEVGFFEDLRAFGDWMVRGTAGRLLGRRRDWSEEYEGRPQMYGNW